MQPSEALTDEQIQSIWDEACHDTPQKPGWNRHIRYARTIEARVRAALAAAPAAEPVVRGRVVIAMDEQHERVMLDLCDQQGLTPDQLMRQALRVYQADLLDSLRPTPPAPQAPARAGGAEPDGDYSCRIDPATGELLGRYHMKSGKIIVEPPTPQGPRVARCESCGGVREWGGRGMIHHAGCNRNPTANLCWVEAAPDYTPPAPQAAPVQAQGVPLQPRVQPWLMECFGAMIAGDREERNHRFLEEALELVQACGCTASEAHQLVDYTFGRPVGEAAQEVGGVMITLAALCLANGLDMHEAGEAELARIWTMVEKIRAKQAAKPKHSPLPEATHPAQPAEQAGEDAIRALIAEHGRLLDDNEYAYFELAYTRRTGWMAWITDKPLAYVVESPDRKIIAQGQGDTPDDACADAARALRGGKGDANA